jgi:hypothetical protein
MGTVWLITRRGTNGGVWNEASNQPHAGRITQVSSVPNTGPAKPARTWIRHLFAKSVAIVLVSLVVTNIGYAFEGSFTPLGSFQFLSRALTRPRTGLSPQIAPSHPWSDVLRSRQNRFVGTWLAALPVPLPRHYVEGFDEQKLETEGVGGQGYPVYLRGEVRRTGWWWYYFYALAVKVPLGTWLLTCVALFTALRFSAGRATFFDESTLAAPVVITLLVMSFLTDINLGLRYVLPIFPYWFVLVSRVACLMHGKRLASLVVLAAIGWNMARSVATHPHHLSFFNELAGGPANGYRHLIDSNLDWGQDLLPLQSWLAARGQGEPIGLAYFGNVDPSILAASGRRLNFALAPPRTLDDLRLVATKPDGEVYRLRNQWIAEHASELQAWLQRKHEMGQPAGPNDHPEIRKLALERIGLSGEVAPGVYAISANLIAGLPFRIRDQEGSIWNAEQDAYSHFRSLTPIAQIGFSIFVYDVSPAQAEQLNASLRR